MLLMKMHQKKSGGFSLIELMVVVAIIGVLAAIALPSYKNNVRKSKRQIAISDMMLYKQAQEKYRTNNLTYATLAQLTGQYSVKTESSSSDYVFTISNNTATTYTITATPQGSQALGSETSCNPLTITAADVKGPSASCWSR